MWGAPESAPALCLGCFKQTIAWMERRTLRPDVAGGELVPVVICPRCHDAGWNLAGPDVELGRWWGTYGRSRLEMAPV